MSWQKFALKDIAPAEPSRFQFHPEEIVWHLTLDQIESNTGFIIGKRMAPASDIGSSTFTFDDGNVLYSKLRPYLNKVIHPREPGIATTELIPLRPRKNLLDADYLTYYLRSNYFLGFAKQCVAGMKMPRIIMTKFWEHLIPLPPLSEQRRIVEILDQADALRKKRAEADAKTERILPALFYKMFGDPATNPKGWPVVDGNTIFSQIRYGVGSPPPFSGNGVPFLRAGNIKRGQVIHHDLVFFEPIHATSISRSKVNEGDIVIVRRGAYTGECAAIPSEFGGAYVGYDLICVPSATTNPRWFSAAFNSTSIWQQIESIRKRAAQQGLNKNQILSFKLPYPPKDLQDKFAQEAASIQTQHGNMAVVKERLKALFHNLLHRAFSGDLTAKWREAHMTELLVEMEEQAKIIDAKGLT